MLDPISNLANTILQLYFYIVMLWWIMSMLITFNVINRHQPIVAKVFSVLEQLVEPALRFIRRYLPSFNGIDLSPLVLVLAIRFLQYSLFYFASHIALAAS